jgi:hypothetical protein
MKRFHARERLEFRPNVAELEPVAVSTGIEAFSDPLADGSQHPRV